MKKFEYREIDNEGWETLEVIAEADRFNEWMYETIEPYCRGKILEIGSGIGNISKFFARDGKEITLSDIRPTYCEVLEKMFPEHPVISLNLTLPLFDTSYAEHISKYDTVFALNVVEHIENDALAIQNCHKLLKPGGKIIILVPAFQKLYNRFDKELEHFRRYTKTTLQKVLVGGGFAIEHSQYFNCMGIPGWFLSGVILKNKIIPKSQMSLYNRLVPLFKVIDRCVFNKVGLSVISVGSKEVL